MTQEDHHSPDHTHDHTHDKSDEPITAPLSDDELAQGLYQMLLIRRFEERCAKLYKDGRIGGFCHLYTGQEAVVVGASLALKDGDHMITGYRDHGHMIACGVAPQYIMAELLGRRDGTSKGKGGSMHLFAPDKGFYGGHGIVGAEVSIGTGLAFASHYRDNGGACLTFFGDGASNQGQVYESFNMATLWKLPIVYIIENNQYAMGTHIERASAQSDLASRGKSFGIAGASIDGMDIEMVYDSVAQALFWARQKQEGPQLIEMRTYRYSGHSMSDPARYRSREEVSDIKIHHDPIQELYEKMRDHNQITEQRFSDMDKAIQTIIDEAERFAQASPQPDDNELMTDIYQ